MTHVLVRDPKDKRHTRGEDMRTQVKFRPLCSPRKDRTQWSKAERHFLEPLGDELAESANESMMLSSYL